MSMALTADGRQAILFHHNGRVQVWDVEARRKVRDLPADRMRLSYARRSPDGKLVACVAHERQGDASAILFWNTHDWSPAGRIECNDPITDFCFAPDGRQVLAAVGYASDKKNNGFTGIVSWDVETKQEQDGIEYGDGFPIRIARSSDGRWVATGGGDAVPVGPNSRSLSGHLRVFDWKAKKLAAEPYTLPSDYVRAVAFSPDGQRLYGSSYSYGPSGRSQAAVRCFSASDWKEVGRVELGSGISHEFTLSPDGRTLLVPDSGGLQAVDTEALKVARTLAKYKFYPDEKEESDRLRAKELERRGGKKQIKKG